MKTIKKVFLQTPIKIDYTMNIVFKDIKALKKKLPRAVLAHYMVNPI